MVTMLSKETIKETAVCYWSNDDECFVVESPLFPRTIGTGETVKKAWSEFEELLSISYEHLKKNNVAGYNKVGRPTKGGIELHIAVRPATKESISKLANKLDISQGEIIDFLLFFYEAKKSENVSKIVNQVDNTDVQKELTKISKKLSYLDQEIHNLGSGKRWKVAER